MRWELRALRRARSAALRADQSEVMAKRTSLRASGSLVTMTCSTAFQPNIRSSSTASTSTSAQMPIRITLATPIVAPAIDAETHSEAAAVERPTMKMRAPAETPDCLSCSVRSVRASMKHTSAPTTPAAAVTNGETQKRKTERHGRCGSTCGTHAHGAAI